MLAMQVTFAGRLLQGNAHRIKAPGPLRALSLRACQRITLHRARKE